jgi:hypothetical protein
MTESEYKELQLWCRSRLNKRIFPENVYQEKTSVYKEAVNIRRQLIFYRSQIKRCMFILEACKEEETITKWIKIVEENKDLKRHWQTQFENLKVVI